MLCPCHQDALTVAPTPTLLSTCSCIPWLSCAAPHGRKAEIQGCQHCATGVVQVFTADSCRDVEHNIAMRWSWTQPPLDTANIRPRGTLQLCRKPCTGRGISTLVNTLLAMVSKSVHCAWQVSVDVQVDNHLPCSPRTEEWLGWTPTWRLLWSTAVCDELPFHHIRFHVLSLGTALILLRSSELVDLKPFSLL